MAGRLPLLLAVAASVVLSVALSFWLLGASRRPAPAAAARPGLAELEARVARLEDELRRARAEALDAPADVPVGAPSAEPTIPAGTARVPLAGGEAPDAELVARLAALEERLLGVEPEAQPPSPAEEMAAKIEEQRAREEKVREAQLTLADPAASVEAKLAAHEALRREPDAYTERMVQDLTVIGENDSDPRVRADVWRNFDGESHLPSLVPHLLRALSSDPHAGPRNEAAETLGNYAQDPNVLAALRHAAEHDPSAHVRRKVLRTLAEWAWLVKDP